MRYAYDSGLPFNQCLAKNILSLKRRIAKKKASLIIVDGGVGEGKTTLAVHIADYYQGSPIDFKTQYGMGGFAFQEKLQICNDLKLPVVVYDEAGDFSKRGSLTEFNKQLNRVFETYRGFRILVILSLPNFGVLDTTFFDNKVPRLLVNCYNRGEQWGNFRSYSLFRMFYIKDYMTHLVVKPKAYQRVRPNFRGQFLDLSPARARELEKISLAGKKEIITIGTLKSQGLVSMRDIGRALRRSVIWVRTQCKKEGYKPDKIYKRQYYFRKDIIELLRDNLGGVGR